MAQRIDKQIKGMKKVHLRLLFGVEQLPTSIKFMPTILLLQSLVPCHNSESSLWKRQCFIEDRKIFGIFFRCRTRQSTNSEHLVSSLLEWKEIRIDVIAGGHRGQVAISPR